MIGPLKRKKFEKDLLTLYTQKVMRNLKPQMLNIKRTELL